MISEEHLKLLNSIGIALSSEHDLNQLLNMVVEHAKNISNSDIGIIFIYDDKNHVLQQKVRHCNRLGIYQRTDESSEENEVICLYNEDNTEHYESVTASCALKQAVIKVDDVYNHKEYDFSSTKAYDVKRNYKTVSILTVPLLNKRKELIGVLRLSNAKDTNGTIIPYDVDMEEVIFSLASQAAVAIDNDMLLKGLEDFQRAFIKIVAKSIDQKSPHTGNHLQKVPVITDMITKAASDSTTGMFKDFTLNHDELYEVSIAAWLHDCGKLTTPDYILEKATKLQTFYDRIETIGTKIEIMIRDAEIDYLRKLQDKHEDAGSLKESYESIITQLKEDWSFIQELNRGAEWIDDQKMERLEQVSKHQWVSLLEPDTSTQSLFSEDEFENLSVRKGTLTAEDRKIIQDHIIHSIDMLNEMPFPRQLRRVPEYAGAHHEKMNGKGYPMGLTGDQMSIPARIIAVSDIFEALTSHDRPYKKPKTLSETYRIMQFMVKDGEIDPEITALLWNKEVGLYKQYAEQHLLPIQIDEPY